MTCEEFDAWIANLTQQIAAKNAQINTQTGVVALAYADARTADTLPNGPMALPITDANIMARIMALYMFFLDPTKVQAAQAAVNAYYALKTDFDNLTMMQIQLTGLQQQLSFVVVAKFNANCP